jgi:hypothetical protein
MMPVDVVDVFTQAWVPSAPWNQGRLLRRKGQLGCLSRRALVMPSVLAMSKTLPTLELRLHIAIEVIGRLHLAQETRSLSCEEHSLIAFLLDQILLLKEVVQHQGGMVPPFVEELLGWNQITSPLGMASS